MSNSRAIMRVNGCASCGDSAGILVEILSGDTQADVADQLNISNYSASVTPAEKYDRLRALKAGVQRVLMIGDGLNDTAALCEAHVSISPSSALDAHAARRTVCFWLKTLTNWSV